MLPRPARVVVDVVAPAGGEVQLEIRPFDLRRGPEERASGGQDGRHRAGLEKRVPQDVRQVLRHVERQRFPARPAQVEKRVVLQVVAHPGQVEHRFDTELPQVVTRADSREHQNLGAVDGARRDDHLAPGAGQDELAAVPVDDARRSVLFDHDALGGRFREGPEVLPPEGRDEEGSGGAAALASPGGGVKTADPFLAGAVEVIVGLETERFPRAG